MKGKWVVEEAGVDTKCKCSACGSEVLGGYAEFFTSPYCPWCGADMGDDWHEAGVRASEIWESAHKAEGERIRKAISAALDRA